jgi:hypothetical protein
MLHESEGCTFALHLSFLQFARKLGYPVSLVVGWSRVRFVFRIYGLWKHTVLIAVIELNLQFLKLLYFWLEVHRIHLLVKCSQLEVSCLVVVTDFDFVTQPL